MKNHDRPGIMFVDDDASMLVTLANNIMKDLQPLQIAVYPFSDFEKAALFLNDATSPSIFASVVDLWMKRRTTGGEDNDAGIALIKIVRHRFPKARILVLSAHLDIALERSLIETYSVTCLKKPASSAEIIEILHPAILTSVNNV